MTLPAKLQIEGCPGENDFRIICSVCKRPVDKWEIETPVARAPFDPSNPLDVAGAVRMANTGEVILTVECHGERFRQRVR